MPPAKRSLAESDSNAQMSSPKKGAKSDGNKPLASMPANPTQKDKKDFVEQLKASKAAAEKELAKSCLDQKARSELSVTSAVLGLIEAGNIFGDVYADGTNGKEVAKSTDKTVAEESSASGADSGLTFVTVCRPHWDVNLEKWHRGYEDSDDEDQDLDENRKRKIRRTHGTKDCMCKKSAAENPNWTWVISTEGLAVLQELEMGGRKRNQNSHGMHIYNDFSAYGMAEIVDNWLNRFNKEITKKEPSPSTIWAQMEGFAGFLQSDATESWFQGDDGDGTAETITIIGTAVLTALGILKKHKLLQRNPGSNGIRNISLVLAMFINFATDWNDIVCEATEETAWINSIIRMTRTKRIQVGGPFRFWDQNVKYFDLEDNPEDKKGRTLEQWRSEFKKYAHDHSINGKLGGSNYDITKFSKSDKRQFQY